MNKPLTLKGTLVKWEMINPHSWFHIEVKGPNGQVVEWMIEGGSPNSLIRQGVTKNSRPDRHGADDRRLSRQGRDEQGRRQELRPARTASGCSSGRRAARTRRRRSKTWSYGLLGIPETLDERSLPALRTFFVPHRPGLSFRQPERDFLGFAIVLVFRALVGMPRVGDGVDLFDRVRRRMLPESTANNDVIVSGLCW